MTIRDRIITEAIQERYPAELAVGFIRYAKLRALNTRQFGWLHKLAMSHKIRFDDAVDRLVDGATPEQLAEEFKLEV